MKTRKLTRVEILRKIVAIVRSVDPRAGLPEVMPCEHQLLIWWQDGRGRRVVVDVGRHETFVELIERNNQCVMRPRPAWPRHARRPPARPLVAGSVGISLDEGPIMMPARNRPARRSSPNGRSGS